MDCPMGIFLLRDKPEESATWEQKQIFMDELQLPFMADLFFFFFPSLLRGLNSFKTNPLWSNISG